MARMMDGEIEKLKRDVPLPDLVQSYGVSLKKKGKDLIGLCPFHDDHEPSLVISPDKNLWHCLGACQAGGSVFDWVMKIEGVSFRHALEILKDRQGIHWKGSGSSKEDEGEFRDKVKQNPVGSRFSKLVKYTTVKKLASPFSCQQTNQELLNQVTGFYHQSLKENPQGLEYLQYRGLCNPEMIDHFKLGFSNRTLGYRLPGKNRREGAAIRGKLQQLGIIRENGNEHFRGSLVIPIFDPGGNVTEIYGRKVNRRPNRDTVLHLYLPGAHRGVWNMSCLAASQEVILCEALIDALTFWCYGFRNVTSSYGINGFTRDHLEAFKQYNTQRVFIAYDNDEGGNHAAQTLVQQLSKAGLSMECFRITFPHHCDANQYVRKFKDRASIAKAIDHLIKNAEWMGKSGVSVTQAANEESETASHTDQPHSHPHNPTLIDILSAPPGPEAPGPEISEAKEKPAGREEERKKNSPAAPSPSSDHPELVNVKANVNINRDRDRDRDDITTQIKEQEIIFTIASRRWRVRGLSKNMSYDQLRVNIMVSFNQDFHVDNLDLYSARQRAIFIKQAANEVHLKEETLKKDLGKILMKCEELQDQQIKEAVAPSQKQVRLTAEEEKEALALLRSPDLLDQVLEHFKICGIVGEETNKLVGYIATASRKMDKPLAVLIQSSSAAGKSSLMESILSFVPGEDRIQYSAMTGQSLYYMGETDLKHKILAIVEEEGAEKASYALKLLQSEGELSIASTGKDPATGRLVTQEYRVQGPVMIFSTTTSIDIDEELQNRCIILTVNESREQTRAIHRLQREHRTLAGVMARHKKPHLLKLHQNAQRLLRPLTVINQFAPQLTFLDEKTRTRRDHDKYLSLIDAIALLHQYQRRVKTAGTGSPGGQAIKYIDVTLKDIEVANRLANEVLGRSLDELPPQPHRLLMIIEEMVKGECKRLQIERKDYRFTRRQVREICGWGNTQLKMHFRRLEEMEYLIAHRGKRGQYYEYELLYDGGGKDGSSFLMGLLDIEALKKKEKTKKYQYDARWSVRDKKFPPLSRPQIGTKSGVSRVDLNPLEKRVLLAISLEKLKKAHLDINKATGGVIPIVPLASEPLTTDPLDAKIEMGLEV